MTEQFLKSLHKSSWKKDCATFEAWLSGYIDAQMCMKQCFDNNNMKQDIRKMVNEDEFTEWLWGLGWVHQ